MYQMIWFKFHKDMCLTLSIRHHFFQLTHWGRNKMNATSQTTFSKCIFFNENGYIFIKFSLKYVRKGPIDNNPALFQIMAWRRPGDKPLSEPMMDSLLTHICVTRPQWVNTLEPKQNGRHFADGIITNGDPIHWRTCVSHCPDVLIRNWRTFRECRFQRNMTISSFPNPCLMTSSNGTFFKNNLLVMSYCNKDIEQFLMAPNRYLNQCWLQIIGIHPYPSRYNCIEKATFMMAKNIM